MAGSGAVADLWEVADEEKLGELLIYTAGQLLDDAPGGATKVDKILYYSEFTHIRICGVPITGVDYQKLQNGPAPRQLVQLRDQLIANGDAVLRVDQYLGKPLHRLVPLRSPRVDALSKEELASVDQVISAMWGLTAGQVSAMSHRELGWNMVDEGEDIPLSTAYLPPRAVMSEAAKQRARELADSLSDFS